MSPSPTVRLVLLLACMACLTKGCECSRDIEVDEGGGIDKPSISKGNPDAPRPEIEFPDTLRQQDESLNLFIEKALQVCHNGDYDAFRQLFGTSYNPPSDADFQRVWHGVKDIRIERIYRGKGDPPKYYVLAVVNLRKPDSKLREQRTAPLMVFQEQGRWRLGPAPGEVVERIHALETQPAATAEPRASQ